MSEYGLQIARADGTIVFDSRNAQGGVFVSIETLAGGSSGTKTYTGSDIAGTTLRYQIHGAGSHDFSIGNDGSGNPTLTYTARAGGSVSSYLTVWAQ